MWLQIPKNIQIKLCVINASVSVNVTVLNNQYITWHHLTWTYETEKLWLHSAFSFSFFPARFHAAFSSTWIKFHLCVCAYSCSVSQTPAEGCCQATLPFLGLSRCVCVFAGSHHLCIKQHTHTHLPAKPSWHLCENSAQSNRICISNLVNETILSRIKDLMI